MTVVSVELRSTDGSDWDSRAGKEPAQPTNPRETRLMASTPMTTRAGAAYVRVGRLGRMRLRPRGMGSGQDRHADSKVRARVFAVDDFDGAAVRVDELEHHGEADAGSLHLHTRGRAAGIESIEHAGAFLRRDTG